MELKKKIISEIEFEDTDKDDFEFGEEVVREYLNSLQYSGKKAEKNKIKNMPIWALYLQIRRLLQIQINSVGS